MKVSVLLQKIREYIIPKDAEIQVAAFNILALCGVIVSVITAIVNAASGHWPVVGADLSGVICSLALMIYCHRTGNYRRAMILTVFIVFLGLFTALYFIQGGYHSGIPAFFIFGVVFTAFLLNGATMVIVSVSLATTMYCQIRVYRKNSRSLMKRYLRRKRPTGRKVIICKNLFLCNRQKTDFYLLMMPGDKKFKTKELSAQINTSRLSFADPEDMLRYLDIEPGAVSIMGLMNDKEHAVKLLIDEDVLKDEYLGCHPCVCTSSLKMKISDVVEKFLPATGHAYQTVHLVGED